MINPTATRNRFTIKDQIKATAHVECRKDANVINEILDFYLIFTTINFKLPNLLSVVIALVFSSIRFLQILPLGYCNGVRLESRRAILKFRCSGERRFPTNPSGSPFHCAWGVRAKV